MRDASPYPVDAPMTSTFFGAFWQAGKFPFTPATQFSTFFRHPSGWAFTQMNPRDRRVIICIGIRKDNTVARHKTAFAFVAHAQFSGRGAFFARAMQSNSLTGNRLALSSSEPRRN